MATLDGSKIGNYRFTDLYWVSLHEIGHVLGLSHSNIDSAVMAPFYRDANDLVDWRGNYVKPELTSDDVRAVQQIYGKNYGGGNRGGGGISSSSGRHRTGSGSGSGSGSERRTSDTYDDREGGFWSRLGKMLSDGDEESNNNDGARRSYHRQQSSSPSEADDGARSRHKHRRWSSSALSDQKMALFAPIQLLICIFCTFSSITFFTL